MNSSLFVAWRSSHKGGQWGPVGRLDRIDTGYRFLYTRGARALPGFFPFPGTPKLDTVYESRSLFPLFTCRLLNKSRPEYRDYLTWGGFDPDNPPDPITILGVTEGRRATDLIEVFPRPTRTENGSFAAKFFLHGIRWMAPYAIEKISGLHHGDRLAMLFDEMNPHDEYAVAVRTVDDNGRTLLGYVPRYLARDIRDLCRDCLREDTRLTVEKVNTNAPLQQRLLCRLDTCWPEWFQPCEQENFQPLVDGY